MSEADILAMTYEDVCTVYRPVKGALDSGETVFKKGADGEKVYECIPCAMAKHSGGKLSKSPSTAAAPTEYCLFVRPEIDIQPNDVLEITRLGKTTLAYAGRADRHVSHNNIPIKLAKEKA